MSGKRTLSMFTMRISDADAVPVARGQSLDGEDWRQVFLRLLRESLPDGSPARKVIYFENSGGPVAVATNMVITSYRDAAGDVHVDLPLFVLTEPPQF